MVEFKEIKIEGFGSILKPFSYVLDGPGIHLIGGKNGVGKTTIFSALCWCLFDRPLKSKDVVTPWKISKDFKGTTVKVTFKKDGQDYWVSRSKNGKRNVVMFSGAPNVRDKKDVQKAIEEILGLSFNLFKNSIVFGQNLTRLMRETGPKQKEVFDEAFEVTYINEAKLKASKKLNEIQKEGDEILSKLDHVKDLLASETRTFKAYEEQEEKTKEAIKELKKDLEENQQKVKCEEANQKAQKADGVQTLSLEKKVEVLKKLEDEHFKLDFTHEQEKAETESIRQKAKKLSEVLAKRIPTCPLCGQNINGKTEEEHKATLRKEFQSLKDRYSVRNKEDKTREARLAQLSASIKKKQKYKKELKEVQSRILEQKNNKNLLIELKGARLKMEAKLEKLRADRLDMGKRKENTHKKMSKLNDQWNQLEAQHNKIRKSEDLHLWVIEDPLSNKGLKAFIFDAMLGAINTQLAYYGKYTGNVVEFSIDLESGNKNFEAVIRDGNLIKPYDAMSGGEQQMIDICLAFSIHDIMTKTKNFNILLMDEIFESLDSDNVELVSELLSIKGQSTAIHIITHQQSMTFNQVTSSITLKKTSKGTIAVR